MSDDGAPEWYSGPIPPAAVATYLDWLLTEHDGDLVEARYSRGATAYHVEVTALEEQSDGTYRAVLGANATDSDPREDSDAN